MRETDFIGQNKQKWVEFEEVLNSGVTDAEKLSRLFVETTDDLSFARTYYPNRSVRVYLNSIAQLVYQKIYRNRKRVQNAFGLFWREELPDALWHARKAMLASFLIFLLGFGIGLLSSAHYPGFVNLILGDSYVAMTEDNIAKGNPMGVYDQDGALETFLYIAWNNIRVGFLCFLLGVLFEVGTIFVIFSNAVMVGAFIYFFIQRSLFWESFYAIMLHGTLELSMIVLAGAAGLVLGRGLVFPGSYSRMQAFLLSARHGIRIMLGVSALLLVAAFIEGFATRYSEAPNVIRGTIILLSLILVLGYFVWLPYRRFRLGKVKEIVETEVLFEENAPYQFNIIKTPGMLINEAWRVMQASAVRVVAVGCILAAAFTAALFSYLGDDFLTFFDNALFYNNGLIFDLLNGFWFWDEANNFFSFETYPALFFILAPLLGLVIYTSFLAFTKLTNIYAITRTAQHFLLIVNGLTAGCVLLLPYFIETTYDGETFGLTLFTIIWWPFWLFIAATAFAERTFLLAAIIPAIRMLRGGFLRLYRTFFLQGLVLWAGMSIAGAPLFYLIFRILGSNFGSQFPWADRLIFIAHTFFLFAAMAALLPIMVYTITLLYYSNQEINEANELRERIAAITFKKQAYGLETDG